VVSENRADGLRARNAPYALAGRDQRLPNSAEVGGRVQIATATIRGDHSWFASPVRHGRCRAVVVPQQPAEAFADDHGPRSGLGATADQLVPDSLVRPLRAVVLGEVADRS
jgi:hypothetical protein